MGITGVELVGFVIVWTVETAFDVHRLTKLSTSNPNHINYALRIVTDDVYYIRVSHLSRV